MENEEDEYESCILCRIEDLKDNMIYSDGDFYCKKCYYEANSE